MQKAALLFLLVFFKGAMAALAQVSFDREEVNVGSIQLSVTNAATIGNPAVTGNPSAPASMEYPQGSGINHLFEGGLWIGALNSNGQYVVSTGAIDASSGYSTGASGYEFTTEIGNTIQQQSTLTSSTYYNPAAISHQDMLIHFTDTNKVVPGTTISIPNHSPLGAVVHLHTYAWNYSFADYFVILEYTITNNSKAPWDSVYCGTWTDLVVRNLKVATDAGAAFYSKGANNFQDSMHAVYAFDFDGDPGYTNSYGAMQFLGIEWRGLFLHPRNASNIVAKGYSAPKVYGNFWNFNSFTTGLFSAPPDDPTRYIKMSQGMNFNDPSVQFGINQPSNRTQLLSAGPIRQVAPGESFKYVMAFVCAKQLPSGNVSTPFNMDNTYARTVLMQHLGWSHRTYDGEDVNENGVLDPGEDLNGNGKIDRYILPKPPATPHMKVIPKANGADIYWDNAAESTVDPILRRKIFEGYRLYISQVGYESNPNFTLDSSLARQWDAPGDHVGYDNGFDAIRLNQPAHFEGDSNTYTYYYSLDHLLNGWQYIIDVTAFSTGDSASNVPSLESSLIDNFYRLFCGTPANSTDKDSIGVYPNPYRLNAAWDGSSSRDRKLYFYNLPAQCDINIYTLSGDKVRSIHHDAAANTGSDAHWYFTYANSTNTTKRILPGGEHAWDILSDAQQDVGQGIYLYSVMDTQTGKTFQGTLTIIK